MDRLPGGGAAAHGGGGGRSSDLPEFGRKSTAPSSPGGRNTRPPRRAASSRADGELGLRRRARPLGIGSRIAKAVARERPDLVGALVVSPPLPGIGNQILKPQARREFWSQPCHQARCVSELMDGQPTSTRLPAAFLVTLVRAGLRAGQRASERFVLICGRPRRLHRVGRLVPVEGRARSPPPWPSRCPARRTGCSARHGALAEHDPLFPRQWSNRSASCSPTPG